MKIDAYYDITCCRCGKSRSTDFGKGMAVSKKFLAGISVREGWAEEEKTKLPICPDCRTSTLMNSAAYGEV